MAWWYIVQLNLPLPSKPSQQTKQKQSYYSATWLCEEIVELWRLACLDPELRPSASSAHNTSDGLWLRGQLARRLVAFHHTALERARGGLKWMLNQRSISLAATNTSVGICGGNVASSSTNSPQSNAPVDLMRTVFAPGSRSQFIGFKPALAACR